MKPYLNLGAALLVASVSALANAQGIAFITDVKGDVSLDNTRAALMAELKKGARIACVRDCVVGVMFLQSGKEYTLKGPGDFVVGSTDVSAKIGPPPAVRDTPWKLKPATVAQVQTASASIRMRAVGAEAAPATAALAPNGTRVASLTPQFRWRGVDATEMVRLEITASDPTRKYQSAATVAGHSYTLPASAILAADTEYHWTVTKGGNVIGKASFQTLPKAALEQLAKQAPAASASFSDRFLYALTLQDLKADQEAREAFAKLASERPDLKELAALAK